MTPYERDPGPDFAFLHREIGPRPGPAARDRWRRAGAVALLTIHVTYLGSVTWLVWYRVGLPAAVAYALVVAAILRLTWRRAPGWLFFAATTLLFLSFVAFVVLAARLGDESAPGYRAGVARATMTWRTAAGIFWLVQWPPAMLRRLWRGGDEEPPV